MIFFIDDITEKMKVLWFSNIEISDSISTTGTWIYTMANSLIQFTDVELINITEANVSELEYRENGRLKQWIIPISKLRKGLPDNLIVKKIADLVNQIKPDVVHIWGTENYWGLLFARGLLKGNVIIDIQGLKFVCYKYFFSGLSYIDIINCIAFKDLVRPQYSILGRAISFKHWGKYELEIIKSIPNIGVQSNWVKAQINNINHGAIIFDSKIQLRQPFLNAEKWGKEHCEQYRIFTSTSTVLSYKGLHTLIDALNILKSIYPQIKLYVAGQISKPGIRQNGYDKFLLKKIHKNKLIDNIIWLGSLDAESLSIELLKANACVVPSYIESYCVALDEALTMGVPSVVSFTGAMPELAKHEQSALYYSPLDSVDCASQIEKLFDLSYAEKISLKAIELKNKIEVNFSKDQLNVYKTVINNSKYKD